LETWLGLGGGKLGSWPAPGRWDGWRDGGATEDGGGAEGGGTRAGGCRALSSSWAIPENATLLARYPLARALPAPMLGGASGIETGLSA